MPGQDQPLWERLQASAVRDELGLLRPLHHATTASFDPRGFAPFSHFGSRLAARERVRGREDAILHRVWLDIRNPLEVNDINDVHGPGSLARSINVLHGFWTKTELAAIERMGEEDALAAISTRLRERGHDGLFYFNKHEDPGSHAWMILDPSQVIPVMTTTVRRDRFAWEIPEAEFAPSGFVLDVFDVDGRDENFDHLWDAAADPAFLLPPCWTGSTALPRTSRHQGYEIRELPEWEPEGTLVLFAPGGVPCGFRMGALTWIDEAHRGRGLSTPLILAAADRMGGPLAEEPCGYSPAGHAAHAAAHRAAVEEAIDEGWLEPPGTEDPRP
ncbi:hypothetical protein LAZ40_09550 [Cereibacter sphaeroides]|uniref:hypothetical protein n=1 Tax=Cereibacter sphaeroides TaxID=1063 RepID=UPI001F24A3EF|nr:hypothetical protein [Cereibacter sphaeroides]MCE6959296.1 hypothetical protein [Cereibacter sphaeroides]MCE6972888.1 hypothetical protein [Cereibacter sphaeroides]